MDRSPSTDAPIALAQLLADETAEALRLVDDCRETIEAARAEHLHALQEAAAQRSLLRLAGGALSDVVELARSARVSLALNAIAASPMLQIAMMDDQPKAPPLEAPGTFHGLTAQQWAKKHDDAIADLTDGRDGVRIGCMHPETAVWSLNSGAHDWCSDCGALRVRTPGSGGWRSPRLTAPDPAPAGEFGSSGMGSGSAPMPSEDDPSTLSNVYEVLDHTEAVIRDGEIGLDDVTTPEKAREAQLELVAHIRDQLKPAGPGSCADPGPFDEGCQRPKGHDGDHTHWNRTGGGSGSWRKRAAGSGDTDAYDHERAYRFALSVRVPSTARRLGLPAGQSETIVELVNRLARERDHVRAALRRIISDGASASLARRIALDALPDGEP